MGGIRTVGSGRFRMQLLVWAWSDDGGVRYLLVTYFVWFGCVENGSILEVS